MSVTFKTRAELVTEAAQCLVVVGSGQPLADEDSDVIDGKVDSLIAQLAVDGIAVIPDDEEIPVAYFDALAELLANNCASKFGMPFSQDKKLTFEANLRRAASSRPTYETLNTDYF